jgi:hypothetical protein
VNPRKYGRDRRRLVGPLAERIGLNYDYEVVAPGSTPPQIALRLVGCGADLLSGLRYADSVPTSNRKVAKSVSRTLSKLFGDDRSRYAAAFLAQAFAVWFEETMAHAGDTSSAAVHKRLRCRVQEFFPIKPADQEELESLRGEYQVLDNHDVKGRFPATGWYMAHLDAEFAEGRDPNTDPELRESQLRYASRYLRLGAEKYALALCLEPDRFDPIAEHLFHPHYSTGWEILEYDLASLKWWTNYADEWQPGTAHSKRRVFQEVE